MSFKKNKYTVIKNAISKDLANFLYNYVLFYLIVKDIHQPLIGYLKELIIVDYC